MLKELRCGGTETLKNGEKKVCNKLICFQAIEAGIIQHKCSRCGITTTYSFKVLSDDKIGLNNETLKNIVRVN